MAQARSDQAPFSARSVFWLVLIGLLATIGFAVTSVLEGDGRYEASSGSNSFSRSALGHAALVELLKMEGWRVQQSQHNTENRLGSDTALLLLEPHNNQLGRDRLEEVSGVVPTLVVLPKRRGVPHPYQAGWIGMQFLMDKDLVQSLARHLIEDATLVRPDTRVEGWTRTLIPDARPDISELQLIISEQIEPIISTDAGILFGRLKDDDFAPTYILSDPDLIATHGLARGANADFAVRLMQTVAQGRQELVVDEVMHGFAMEPSLARAMFSSPFVYATLAVLLALVMFLLALTRRFGAPWRDQDATHDSKAVFIGNAARILTLAGKEQEALIRLMDDTAVTVARQLNAPTDLPLNRLHGWLDTMSHKRAIAPDFTTLRRRVVRISEDDDTRARRLLILANQFNTWKREILNEPK
ncbi:MAG: hypothetical protein EP335_07785 [Alphaproteobacteria bacterium]|nr:MAG: hypothetical protein EP335_07785 [Alphaproteobacteria bacterium]